MAADYDLAVVGGGSAGLTIAKYGPKLGARVALIEQAQLGGDCTWRGCVPSKALIAAARVAALSRRREEFGLPRADGGPVDLARVMERVRETQLAIHEAEDSPDALRAAGADVIAGRGEFVSPSGLRAGGRPVRARRYCVAPGALPIVPDVPGLDAIPHYTSDTIFTELRELPRRLLVIGGGATGLELGQALARLGAGVAIAEAAPGLLPGEDRELVRALRLALAADGVEALTSTRPVRFGREGGRGYADLAADGGAERRIGVDAVLIAAGKRPNLQGMGLEAAGVEYDEARGVRVDRRLRTSNPRVFAAGDAIGGPRSTPAAVHEAGVVLANALTPLRRETDYRLAPRVVFTDPELASVGLAPGEARARHGRRAAVWRSPFADNNRAAAERTAAGFAQVVTAGRRGRIVGAQIAGPAAGELIHEYALAVREGVPAAELAQRVHAYPTLANAPQLAAARALEAELGRPRTRIALALWLTLARLRERRGGGGEG